MRQMVSYPIGIAEHIGSLRYIVDELEGLFYRNCYIEMIERTPVENKKAVICSKLEMSEYVRA